MKTDRELLELAAKAAGVDLDCAIRPDGKPFYHSDRNAFAIVDGGWFAPLTDDGDALRLAVKLSIDIKQYGDHVVAWFDGGFIGTGRIQYDGDPCAATRRAILLAAAAIGEAME